MRGWEGTTGGKGEREGPEVKGGRKEDRGRNGRELSAKDSRVRTKDEDPRAVGICGHWPVDGRAWRVGTESLASGRSALEGPLWLPEYSLGWPFFILI